MGSAQQSAQPNNGTLTPETTTDARLRSTKILRMGRNRCDPLNERFRICRAVARASSTKRRAQGRAELDVALFWQIQRWGEGEVGAARARSCGAKVRSE